MGFFRNMSFLWMGNRHFTVDGFLKASKTFDNSIMERRLDGKVCMVTGANTGIGLKVAEELAQRGCVLLMVCRNASKGQEAVEKIKSLTGNTNVHLKVCDISSLQSIAQLSKELKEQQQPLHVLVNNAGALINDKSQRSADGYDPNFATNTLGTYALTHALLPLLEASAPSRVIIVASGGMLTEPLVTDDFNNDTVQPYSGSTAYARDKRRQVAIAEVLSERWGSKGVGIYSMHPGWADTEGVSTSLPEFHKFFQKKLRTTAQAADTIVYLALEESERLQPGAFYLDRAVQEKHLSFASTKYTPAEAGALCDKLTAIIEDHWKQNDESTA